MFYFPHIFFWVWANHLTCILLPSAFFLSNDDKSLYLNWNIMKNFTTCKILWRGQRVTTSSDHLEWLFNCWTIWFALLAYYPCGWHHVAVILGDCCFPHLMLQSAASPSYFILNNFLFYYLFHISIALSEMLKTRYFLLQAAYPTTTQRPNTLSALLSAVQRQASLFPRCLFT